MVLDDAQAVVLDSGAGSCKVGLAGDREPRVTLPSVVGCPCPGTPVSTLRSEGRTTPPVGDKVPGSWLPCSVIDHGVVTNWDFLEKIWSEAFSGVSSDGNTIPKGMKVLLTESSCSKTNREMIAELLFETYEASALNLQLSGVLALHAAAKQTGLVLELGHGTTCAVPVVEGFLVKHAVKRRTDIGGDHLSTYLARMLGEERCISLFSKSSPLTADAAESLRAIKEQLCYVALDGANADPPTKRFSLPDGTTVDLGAELHMCPEALFTPHLLQVEEPGLHDILEWVLGKCEQDVRRDLSSNILLTGGSALFPNIPERLRFELMKSSKYCLAPKVSLMDDPVNAAFRGGSIVAEMEQLPWTSRREYEEQGQAIVHHKCKTLLF